MISRSPETGVQRCTVLVRCRVALGMTSKIFVKNTVMAAAASPLLSAIAQSGFEGHQPCPVTACALQPSNVSLQPHLSALVVYQQLVVTCAQSLDDLLSVLLQQSWIAQMVC